MRYSVLSVIASALKHQAGQSDACARFGVPGPDARVILTKGAEIDLDPAEFGCPIVGRG